jgi:D-cysteine desulfhydrase
MMNIPIAYRLPACSLNRTACFSCNVMKNGPASKNLEDVLQDRAWLLDAPDSRLTTIKSGKDSSFTVIRDDLLHPFASGNKIRKLDGLWPELVKRGVKDVITCGGLQSAHLLAVAALAAQHGMRSHLLVRGNRPDVLTGNHLFAKLFSSTTVYVSRSEYADREEMFRKYASSALGYNDVLTDDESSQVAILPEGGALVSALFGMIRFVNWLAFRLDTLNVEGIRYKNSRIVVDSGTGTTAIV